MLSFSLVEALLGRRSRRFFMGAEIPDGAFAYKSRREPLPLTDAERFLVVSACGGNTSWHHMIHRAARYAPHLSNYCGAAGGRTFRPGEKHWFQGGPEGAVVYSFSSVVRDVLDGFTDPAIERITRIEED